MRSARAPSEHCVLVTGATSGFGRATARRFVAAGARVIAAGRRTERLAALVKECGDRLLPVPLDVRDEAAVFAAVAGLPPSFADISVLVNSAGLALGLEPAHQVSIDDWTTMIDTNVRGLAVVTRAVLPGMVARGRGHVINLGSIAGEYPYPGGNVYCGTKAFVRQFSLALRADLHSRNVRVTVVEPGMAETEFSEVRLKDMAKARAVYQGIQALSAEDVAETVYWAATLPDHVNINVIEVMPTAQAFGPFAVHRTP